MIILKAKSMILREHLEMIAGLEIATNMVANGTSFFSLATKIFV